MWQPWRSTGSTCSCQHADQRHPVYDSDAACVLPVPRLWGTERQPYATNAAEDTIVVQGAAQLEYTHHPAHAARGGVSGAQTETRRCGLDSLPPKARSSTPLPDNNPDQRVQGWAS